MKRFILLLLEAAFVFLTGCGAQGQEESLQQEESRIQSSAAGRTVLTVATDSADAALTARVNAFNENSETYYVEIKQYEQEEMSDDPIEAFATQLTMDILSGNGPDMVNLSGGSYSPAIASEKLMVNLYSYMEADEDFKKEEYYENILEAFELNGGLYVMPFGFEIETMCGKAEELGTDRGLIESWEIGEMIEAYENSAHAQCLTMNDSNWLTFQGVCGGCIGNFVNWETGECRFNTPEFIELLEFSNTFSGELILANSSDFSFRGALSSGKAFLQPVLLKDPWRVADMRISFGDTDVLWPGYPVADGQKEMGGGVAVPCDFCLSICANSRNRDAAWEFVKSFLSSEMQREVSGIPLLKSVSEERIQELLAPEYELSDGERKEKIRYEIIAEGEETIGLSTITKEDAEIFRSIIANTHRSTGNAPGMFNIIREEVSAYYEKGKDAAAVAEIIQNRVSVFVSERME